MMRRLTWAVLVISLLGCSRQAAAQACSYINGTCTLTDGPMTFPAYTDGGSAVPVSPGGTVTCISQTDTWNIPLGPGQGTVSNRYMLGAVSKQKLYYEVYQDAAHQNIWGNTPNPGGNEVCGTGNASVTFYGLIAAGQNPPPDTYTDSLSTDTTQFTVTEVVVKACSISATNLAFGTYVGTLINSTSTISVTCTNTTTYTVGLSAGASGNVAARTMKNGTHILNYALYQNSTHTTNWGNTTNMEAGTGNGALQALTVYGQLPAGTVPAAGNYTDTITATITY